MVFCDLHYGRGSFRLENGFRLGHDYTMGVKVNYRYVSQDEETNVNSDV